MPFVGKVGFRGIAVFNESTHIRFASCDIGVKQEPNVYLPAYGGTRLKTIFSKGTMDISGNISGPLTDGTGSGVFASGKGSGLFKLASEQQEFNLDLHYFDNQSRRFLGCKIDTLQFTCNAGEIINFSATIVAKLAVKVEGDVELPPVSYTKAEKLYTHDKCSVTFEEDTYVGEKMLSFSYTITNGYKVIKTASSLAPTIIGNAIQDVSGQMSFLNTGKILYPLENDIYGLSFKEATFKIGDISQTHLIVFHPTQNIPLTPGAIVTNMNWTRADSYYTEP